ncbi:MAG: lipoate--protein ligase family protein [Pedosphaera sp.]|nr:lipoate--protein ligase family protein [Pedosphaera sp.]
MNTWLLLQSVPADGAFNMALDEALFETAAQRGWPVLRVYEWESPCATFGYSQRYEDAAAATVLRPLIRRITGGGWVPHESDWTYSLSFPPQHEWTELSARTSYEKLHAWWRDAFAAMGIETTLAEDCRRPKPGECFEGHEQHDLLWRGRKIAGAAQRRNRSGLLIQGSIQPGPSWDRAAWIAALQAVSKKDWSHLSDVPVALARKLTEERYRSQAHNRRR